MAKIKHFAAALIKGCTCEARKECVRGLAVSGRKVLEHISLGTIREGQSETSALSFQLKLDPIRLLRYVK